MKSRQEQLKELGGGGFFDFLVPAGFCLFGFLMLFLGVEFYKASLSDIDGQVFMLLTGLLLFAVGVIIFMALVIFPTVERLDVEKRLSYALCLLDAGLSDQKDIDHELARRAQLADEASEQHIQAQGAVKRALTEEEEEKLRGKEGEKKDNFNLCNKDFQVLCLWAESAGYKIRKTSKGKPSFRLYIPKREVQPSASTSRKDQEHLGDPEPPI